MELQFIGVSTAQKADLESARSILAQQQAEERRREALAEAENKKRETRKALCTQADQLARKKATHQVFVGNQMGGNTESFSDWATLEAHDDNSVVQACIRRWTIPEFSNDTSKVAIQLRLKDIQTGTLSGAETVLHFIMSDDSTYLRDSETTTDVEVVPESEEYAEVRALLKELETAEYEVVQQPLIGS